PERLAPLEEHRQLRARDAHLPDQPRHALSVAAGVRSGRPPLAARALPPAPPLPHPAVARPPGPRGASAPGAISAVGRTKLAVLLGREGLEPSPSTVGRILRDLRRRGQLHEPRAYAVASALGGGQRLRMAPYVTEDGATGGHPPPEGAKVGYAQVSD